MQRIKRLAIFGMDKEGTAYISAVHAEDFLLTIDMSTNQSHIESVHDSEHYRKKNLCGKLMICSLLAKSSMELVLIKSTVSSSSMKIDYLEYL